MHGPVKMPASECRVPWVRPLRRMRLAKLLLVIPRLRYLGRDNRYSLLVRAVDDQGHYSQAKF
jgi:hypothetical protein